MTAHTNINAALASHGLLPMDGACICPVCNATSLTRDEMATPDVVAQDCASFMLDTYGGPICRECLAFEHFQCPDCCKWNSNDELIHDHVKGFVCASCSPDYAADQDAEHRCDEYREGVR